MHIIFERSNGHIRSNCNILALAWMPHYNESAFRKSHLTYQQRQLADLTGPFGYQLPLEPSNGAQPVNEDVNRRGLQEILRRQPEVNNIRPGERNSDLENLIKTRAYNNSRLIEQLQRFVHTDPRGARELNNCDLNDVSNAAINDHIDELYGKMDSFGWLAIGNIGKMVGVTLTSTIEPAIEIDGRKSSTNERDDVNLIDLSENNSAEPNSGQDKQRRIAGATLRPDRRSARSNYNLRGHLDEVILVKWNEIYQKLASVDSKGNVLIWSKSNEKFTIQTPFYNKSKSVADFKWSNDGKTALICYTDSFILVGSSFSQRHWHSMLNLEDYHITCASWTSNDEQLLLGVSNGNIILIDLPTSELTELAVGQANIRTMCWSSSELNLRHLEHARKPSSPSIRGQRDSVIHLEPSPSGDNRSESRRQQNVVNRRRLSLNCALFCRHRPLSSLTNASASNTGNLHPRRSSSATRQQQQPQQQQVSHADNHSHREILAIDFADNTIKLFNGGLSDPKPRLIQVQLESYLMAWSSDGRILAVGGFNIYTSAPSVGCLRCKYLNTMKFYNQEGQLVHERRINFTRYPITALTWAHNDRRLFVATGPRLHCAKVFMGVPQLSLLSMACLYRNTKLMDKSDALMNLVKRQFVSSLLNWQSFNCPIQIDSNSDSISRQQQLVACKAKAPDSNRLPECGQSEPTSDQQQAHLVNNVNISNYQLPAKLKSKIDQLFSQTTRQPYDEQFSLGDVAWHVPKSQQRIHCTLVCYTHELLDAAGCLGYQYKVQDAIQTSGMASQQQQQQQQQQQRSKSSGPIEPDLQFKIFVLYVEFQGSLVPILKARRIGFLKPEFVLFDPEPKFNGSLQRYYKVSDIYQNSSDSNRGLQSSPCAELHGASHMGNLSPLITRRQASGSQTRTQTATRLEGASPKRIIRDPHLFYLLSLSQQQRSNSSRDKQTAASSELAQKHELMKAIERQRLRSLRAKLSGPGRSQSSMSSGPSGLRSLPETSELIRIKSNIWGTKFKLINMSNKAIDRRAVLGSVRYKASLLHLQPRQIHLTMKDMSNYCVLCSVHHHTKMHSQKRTQTVPAATRRPADARKPSSSTPMSLLDLPLATPNHLPGFNSGRHSRRRHKSSSGAQLDESEKLVLAVGDTIRVAPQLEPHQRYKLAERSSSLSSAPSSRSRHRSLMAQTSVQAPGVRSHSQRHGASFEAKPATKRLNRAAGSQFSGSKTSQAGDDSDQMETSCGDEDVLTMSIDQGDQVQLVMSSENKELDQAGGSKPSRSNADEQKIDDFLRANKTLKSIQKITSMIVDLSAKAQEEVVNGHQQQQARTNYEAEASPMKLLKMDNSSGIPQRSPSHYIPPETPVHRPRRNAAHNKRGLQTKSVTNSPSASHRARLETRNLTACHSLDPGDPLPPPPPPVPLRRRLSISAKRFIDGSLRSLSSLGVSGNSTSYLTGDEADTEECEVLVKPRRQRQSDKRGRLAYNHNRHQSQPCTPMRSGFIPARQPTIDLASLRSQVVEKLRLSSGWMSPARRPKERQARGGQAQSSARQSSSCTKRSNWILKGARGESLPSSSNGQSRGQSLLSPCESSSSSDLSSSSISSSCSSSSSDENEPNGLAEGDFSFLNQATRAKLFKKSSRLSSSVKEFGCLEGRPNSRNADDRRQHAARRTSRETTNPTRPRRVRKCASKSICSSPNCCCGREFKLSNRPPVWNELSQVYQLDFGGRVTQESAKNLQIDFNGSLALQFGRIDKCTYTLDYQFPFNAVQAMSIALASLTQRLK